MRSVYGRVAATGKPVPDTERCKAIRSGRVRLLPRRGASAVSANLRFGQSLALPGETLRRLFGHEEAEVPEFLAAFVPFAAALEGLPAFVLRGEEIGF